LTKTYFLKPLVSTWLKGGWWWLDNPSGQGQRGAVDPNLEGTSQAIFNQVSVKCGSSWSILKYTS